MALPGPGARREARRALRRFRNACRGAAAWVMRPTFDPAQVAARLATRPAPVAHEPIADAWGLWS